MGKEAKFVVRLSAEERELLEGFTKAPRVARAKALRARMLLKADVEGPAWTDSQIAEAFEVSESTVHRLREQVVEEGLESALNRKPHRRTRPPKLDGEKEARLIAVACGPAPQGRVRWTMQLLADKLVELKVVEKISDETVRLTLKKTSSSPGSRTSGSSLRRPMPSSSVKWKRR